MKTFRRTRPEAVEVHLEELDAHSWLKARPDTVLEPFGTGQYRFVVVPAGTVDHSLKEHVAASVSFPALLLQDPDGATQPDAWLDVACGRLAELNSRLVADGWRRRVGRGRHWWSFVYDDAAREAAVPAAASMLQEVAR